MGASLLTATPVLGLLPLALGGEINGPMALVILGGLGSSTALNLLVLPVLAARFGRWNTGKETRRLNASWAER